MDSIFNIYQDILPAFNMYSGLKTCHAKYNLPFDLYSEFETILK